MESTMQKPAILTARRATQALPVLFWAFTSATLLARKWKSALPSAWTTTRWGES